MGQLDVLAQAVAECHDRSPRESVEMGVDLGYFRAVADLLEPLTRR